MLVLGIETSCDDTCAAVVKDETQVLSSVVSSQHEFHEPYGGVVPEIAARQHTRLISLVVRQALSISATTWDDFACIAVTTEPGLIGSLLVGVGVAKGISMGRNLPICAVNHILAHIQSVFLTHHDVPTPHVGLVVSGGHTVLFLVNSPGDVLVLGSTLDDAAGEAIDKAANLLNLGYPGGPAMDRLAADGDPQAVVFPRPIIDKKGFNFSFSGLKTSLAVYLRKQGHPDTEQGIRDLCSSYLEAVVDVLVAKSIRAARSTKVVAVTLTGGVAANSRLRSAMSQACLSEGIELFVPRSEFCTDNAAMVASLGARRFLQGERDNLAVEANATTVLPRWAGSTNE